MSSGDTVIHRITFYKGWLGTFVEVGTDFSQLTFDST